MILPQAVDISFALNRRPALSQNHLASPDMPKNVSEANDRTGGNAETSGESGAKRGACETKHYLREGAPTSRQNPHVNGTATHSHHRSRLACLGCFFYLILRFKGPKARGAWRLCGQLELLTT